MLASGLMFSPLGPPFSASFLSSSSEFEHEVLTAADREVQLLKSKGYGPPKNFFNTPS